MAINLCTIFRHLTGDEKLLSTIIDNTNTMTKSIKKTTIKQENKFNIMTSIVPEYVSLTSYETQSYSSFPHQIKKYLTPDHMRFGVKNIIERDMVNINVSFLNSLNILLRPELTQTLNEDYLKDLTQLEEFIKHRITRNYQIDKTTKNTKRIQEINKNIIKNMAEGKITHELVQYIVDIFEINLLVFDFITYDITLYWTYAAKHPSLNIFKNIHCIAYAQGNYEPIITKNNYVSKEYVNLLYAKILTDKSIKYMKEITLSPQILIKIEKWDIPGEMFIQILEKYFDMS